MRLAATDHWTSPAVELFLLTPELVSQAYIDWLADPEINRYLESRFTAHDRASTEAYVASMLESERSLMLGIRSAKLDRHVGNIKLGPIDSHHSLGEIGIMIGDREAWGRGIASQAIAMLSEIAKEQLGLRRLTAGCYESNIGSRRAFERAGFVVEGVRPAHFLLDGKPEGLVLMGRLLS